MSAELGASTVANRDPECGEGAHAALWETLVHDSGAQVMVVDGEGEIRYANELAASFFGGKELVGRKLTELLGPEVGGERTVLVRGVTLGGRAVTVDGMVRGSMQRSVMRPLPTENGSTRVLITTCLLAPGCRPNPATEHVRAEHDDSGLMGRLTDREREILRLIGEGMATAEIAARLGRSGKTVEWHRVSLGEKLGVSNRVELARIAISSGLVSVHNGHGTP